MAWQPGKTLNGDRYAIEGVLGQGRFGLTYLARDRNHQPVVIKTPNDECLNKPDFDRLQQVFVKEAFKLAKCRHPHIVRTEEPFQEGGIWCLVMEYIDGNDLARRAQTILPEAEALQYIRQIGEALIEVHHNELVHCDIRPGNIMVRAGKAEAVLIDFGLAMNFDHELTQTRTEEIMKGFAPIELYSRSQDRCPYTDIYALGATLYVLLTGQVPPDAKDRKISNVSLRSPKDINPQISDRVNEAILKAMEVEAHKRPQSVQAWLDLLENAPPQPPSVPSVPPQPQRQINWTVVWTAVAAIGALLAGLGLPQLIEIWGGGKSNSSPPSEASPNPSPSAEP